MKPVYQKIIDGGTGDCFSACLASLLELPLEMVPKFKQDHGAKMMDAARKWLAEQFQLSIVTIRMPKTIDTGDDIILYPTLAGTPCIAAVSSPNFPGCDHAVVGEIDRHEMNFQLTHDPNENGKQVTTSPKFLYFLVPLKPEKYKI